VVIQRGEVWWAELDELTGSEPGYRRPVLIIQADGFNRSRLQTTIAVVLTSNLRLIDAPGNVLVPKQKSGLPKDSVANVSQLVTLDRDFLSERAGKLPTRLLAAVDAGLKLVLALR
jgi:mRNA interferase MazF